MKHKAKFIRTLIGFLALVAACSWLLAVAAEAQTSVTSPEKFFGFRLGSDRKIARWDKIVEYYGLLEKESDGRSRS